MTKKLRTIFSILLAVILVVTVAACGDSNSNSDSTEQTSSTSAPAEADDNIDLSFKTPAEAFEKADDPGLSYTFDDEGKVIGCIYSVDGRTYNLSYSYNGNQLHVLGFCDSVVVVDEQLTLPGEYNPNGGYTQIDGFYVKGF